MEAPARSRPGAPVPLVFKITNTGRIPVTLQLLGRNPTADFVVSDSSGRAVWSRLRGRTLLGPLRLFPLGGGKSLSFRQIWNQHSDAGSPVKRGEYLIQGVLLTDDPKGLASPLTRVRIE
jgi:hypothetical protein